MPLLKTITLLWYIIEYCLESIWYRLWGSEDRDEEDVRGKVVVITGGNAGVGKSLAMKLADRGATVVLGESNKTFSQVNQYILILLLYRMP
jgi:5,10-methylene-tetrahydrofolate dehydrogenase/methenyl tetrahydrofolate cyclohydrolase